MMDSFTAKVLLEATAKSGDDRVADLYKEINNKVDGGPTKEARDFFEQHQGKPCKIKHTSREGIVYRLNEATRGFYPGSRYPIKVQITNGEAAGAIFEYDLEQIEIVE